MPQWLRLNVGKGKVGSVRLLSDAGIAEMHRPQMVVPADPQDPEKKAGDKAKGRLELEQKKGTRPAHPLDEYAGEYEHAA